MNVLYNFYINLIDKDYGQQIISNAKVIKIIDKYLCICSVTFGTALFLGEIQPQVIIEVLENSDHEALLFNSIDRIKKELNQESVLCIKTELLKEILL